MSELQSPCKTLSLEYDKNREIGHDERLTQVSSSIDCNNSWSISHENDSEINKGIAHETCKETKSEVKEALTLPEVKTKKLENKNNSNKPDNFGKSFIVKSLNGRKKKDNGEILDDINNSQRRDSHSRHSSHDFSSEKRKSLIKKKSSIFTGLHLHHTHSMTKTLEAIKKGQRSSTKHKKGTKYLNTYQLAPLSGHEFSWLMAQQTVTSAVNAFFNFDTYDITKVRAGIKHLADVVVHRLSDCHTHDRFKVVSHVTVAQLSNQGVAVADRTLGHAGTDNCFTLTRRMRDYVVVCSVYGMYVE